MIYTFSIRQIIGLLALAATATFFSACSDDFFSQTVSIDPPPYEKVMVLHQFLGSHDSVFRVDLSRNYGILENVSEKEFQVKGATVELLENGQAKLTLAPQADSLWIYSAVVPNGQLTPGAKYELRIQHPDFQILSSQQVLPKPVVVDSATFRQNGGINRDGSPLSAYDVYLQDPLGERNYYMLQVIGTFVSGWSSYTDSLGNIVRDTTYSSGYKYTDEPLDPNAKYGAYNSILIDDTFFDGQKYKFTFRSSEAVDSGNAPKEYAILRCITEDYYRYLISALQKYESEDTPLSEPVPAYNNLTNGIGIFGLFDEQVFEVR